MTVAKRPTFFETVRTFWPIVATVAGLIFIGYGSLIYQTAGVVASVERTEEAVKTLSAKHDSDVKTLWERRQDDNDAAAVRFRGVEAKCADNKKDVAVLANQIQMTAQQVNQGIEDLKELIRNGDR